MCACKRGDEDTNNPPPVVVTSPTPVSPLGYGLYTNPFASGAQVDARVQGVVSFTGLTGSATITGAAFTVGSPAAITVQVHGAGQNITLPSGGTITIGGVTTVYPAGSVVSINGVATLLLAPSASVSAGAGLRLVVLPPAAALTVSGDATALVWAGGTGTVISGKMTLRRVGAPVGVWELFDRTPPVFLLMLKSQTMPINSATYFSTDPDDFINDPRNAWYKFEADLTPPVETFIDSWTEDFIGVTIESEIGFPFDEFISGEEDPMDADVVDVVPPVSTGDADVLPPVDTSDFIPVSLDSEDIPLTGFELELPDEGGGTEDNTEELPPTGFELSDALDDLLDDEADSMDAVGEDTVESLEDSAAVDTTGFALFDTVESLEDSDAADTTGFTLSDYVESLEDSDAVDTTGFELDDTLAGFPAYVTGPDEEFIEEDDADAADCVPVDLDSSMEGSASLDTTGFDTLDTVTTLEDSESATSGFTTHDAPGYTFIDSRAEWDATPVEFDEVDGVDGPFGSVELYNPSGIELVGTDDVSDATPLSNTLTLLDSDAGVAGSEEFDASPPTALDDAVVDTTGFWLSAPPTLEGSESEPAGMFELFKRIEVFIDEGVDSEITSPERLLDESSVLPNSSFQLINF